MIKGKVFFHPIDGFASLTISWSSRPKGDAIEAKKGDGVGFFSKKGELLCVIFDEVQEAFDHQILEFKHHTVDVSVKKGKITYILKRGKTPRKSKLQKKRSAKRLTRKKLKTR